MATTKADERALVIGNGPVGQTAALCLARWGIPVLVLDARAERDPIGSKALCQQRDVLDLWDACGAGRVATDGLTWSTARTFYQGQELFSYRIPDSGHSPLPPFVNISQAVTEDILDEAIATEPLIEVKWGHEVVGFESGAADGDDIVTVRCATAEGEVTEQGAYALLCGGSKGNPLREMLGVGFPGRTFDDAFLICDIEATLPGWEHERRFYFDPQWNPGRQVLIHPCPNGIYRIDWQVPEGFDLEAEQADGRLDTRIRQVIGDQDYRIDWVSVYRFHARSADRYRLGRLFLAGDLAHIVSPFGARGLNSGVPDTENAAWKVAYAMKGWAGPELLDSYAAERVAAAAENIDVTSHTMDFLVPQTPEQHARRKSILEAAKTDPSMVTEVDSGRLAEPFWYVESALTTPSASRPWPGRPPRGDAPAPVPGVILPDAPVSGGPAGITRVRQLARDGLLVLVGDAVDAAAVVEAMARAVPAGLPVRVVAFGDLGDEGKVAGSLQARPAEMWLVRPDAYTAAAVTSVAELTTAVRRVLGG
ncbi:MAG: FAD-dependent monooxygenase [Dermatophilaceae bacterium]